MLKAQYSTHQRLLTNSLYNGLGILLPVVVGLWSIPRILQMLGTTHFGILTIVWMLLGYFSLFDLGLGRALTKIISEKLARGRTNEVAQDLWTSLAAIFTVSLVVAILVWLGSGPIARLLFHEQGDSDVEVLHSLQWIALGLPAVTMTSILKGFLEALKKFKELNLVQVLMGTFNFLSPLLLVSASEKLASTVFILMLARWFFLIVHLWMCLKMSPFALPFQTRIQGLSKILSLGGWMTVSNIVGPIMIYFDRFILSALSSGTAVAFYTTPYEIVSRLLAIPQAVTRALFPELLGPNESQRRSVLKTSTLVIGGLMLIPTLIALFLGTTLLTWWLGPEFAAQSTLVLKILSVGVFVNSIAWVPFTEIQGLHRADLTAKLHLIELCFYLPGLFLMIQHWSIAGAALCWTLRALVDALALFGISRRLSRRMTE